MFGYLGVAPPPDPEAVEGAAVPEPMAVEAASAVAGDEGAASPAPSCPAVAEVALAEPVVVEVESAELSATDVPQDVALEHQYEFKPSIKSAWTDDPIEAEEEEEEEEKRDPPLNRNVVHDAMIKLLNQRVYSDDPPITITAEDVAGIPDLACTQEAADFIDAVQENIDLINLRADAAMRAKKLEDLKKANAAKRCRHVKFSGEDCGSPALRNLEYCHFHAQIHAACVDIPVIEDQRSLQVAFARLANQVASNKIDATHARVLLQILESAGRSLPAEPDSAAMP
jgi:hypothetical protein